MNGNLLTVDPAERPQPWRVTLRERLDGLLQAEPDRHEHGGVAALLRY